MDLSKLPRLSKAPQPPAETPAPATFEAPVESAKGSVCPFCRSPLRDGAKFCDSCGEPLVRIRPSSRLAGVGPEAWISIVLAAILLMVYPNFLRYLSHPHDTSTMDAFDGATGATIPYTHSAFIWTDSAITLFCLAMLIDAAVMLFAPKRSLLLLAAALSALSAAYNGYVIAHCMPLIGFQIHCALAVGFGLYLSAVQFNAAKRDVS